MTRATIESFLRRWCKGDGYCGWCGKRGDLEGHHILTKGAFPSLILCPINWFPLCWECHRKVHADRERFFAFLEDISPGLVDWLRRDAAKAWSKRDRDETWALCQNLLPWGEFFEIMRFEPNRALWVQNDVRSR